MQNIHNTTQHIVLSDGWEATIYRDWNFPPEVTEKWDTLVCQYGDTGLFISYGWFENWWRAFGKQTGGLLVFVLKNDGKTKAIFPCCLKTYQNGKSHNDISSLTNDHTCHYDFIIEPDRRKEALSHFIHILRRNYPDSRLFFECLPVTGENALAFISALHCSRIPVHSYKAPWAPWMEIPRDWITFNKQLPGRLRNTLQRSRKKADKAGKLEFELIRDSDQLDSILSLVFDIEYKSWKGRNGTAMKCQPEVENFYRTLAHWAAAQKNLHIFILKLDKIPIAATFCLSFGNTVFLLKIGYDESFSKFSPGSLLHCEIFEYLSQAQQFTIYNFLGATELWKMEWTEKTSDYGFIRVYPKTIRGWSGYMFKYGWKNIIKRILRKVYALTDSNRHH